MIYDGMLMLSGGKDSCSIALTLFKENKNILLFTNDVGFVSDTAKLNIEKIKQITGFDSIVINDFIKYHKVLVDNFFQNLALRMEKDLCHSCTKITEYVAQTEARKRGINVIYNGHTSQQMGDTPDAYLKSVKIINGIEWRTPYYASYDLDKIKKELTTYGIEWCPTKTNCIPVRDIIREEVRRTKINPFGIELDKSVANGSLSAEDVFKIRAFCTGTSKRLHKDGYFEKRKISSLELKYITRMNKNKK